MSQEAISAAPTRRRRRPWVRVAVRLPFLVELGAAVLLRLPRGSRVRRRVLEGGFRVAWGSINRSDFEPAGLAYERDAEVVLFGAEAVGLDERYSGERGWFDMFRDIFEIFGTPRFTTRRIVDGGDRIVAEIGLAASGMASGLPVEGTVGTVYFLSSRGLIARQEIFWSSDGWNLALEAAGLS